MNRVLNLEFGLKSEEDEAAARDKKDDKESEEYGVEVRIKTEEIMLEDFKQENEPDPPAGSTVPMNFIDPTLGHVVYLPTVKSELMSEDSNPDQDEDISLKCEIELGDYEGPNLEEGEAVVKIEPTSSDSNTAGYSVQESKIPYFEDGDDHDPSREEDAGCEQKKKKDSELIAKVLDNLKIYRCRTCSYNTPRISDMRRHIKIHTGYKRVDKKSGCKTFCCQNCSYRTARSTDLRRHMKIHTENTTEQRRRVMEENSQITLTTDNTCKTYRCQICQYNTAKLSSIKRHMLAHTGIKPFVCSECLYSFSHASGLKRHMTVHTGHKAYTCSQCSFSSSAASNLKKHMTIHSGLKAFVCSRCSYSSRNSSNLARHMAVHSDSKPYKCSRCSYSSSRSGDLKNHMTVHAEEKSFCCAHCDYKTARRCHLIQHLRVHSFLKD